MKVKEIKKTKYATIEVNGKLDGGYIVLSPILTTLDDLIADYGETEVKEIRDYDSTRKTKITIYGPVRKLPSPMFHRGERLVASDGHSFSVSSIRQAQGTFYYYDSDGYRWAEYDLKRGGRAE